MKNNLVSIIVPVYKVEKYLDRCINSLVNQTHGNIEIILVDDGSPDNCPQMCDDWAKKDARIKVIHKQNGGLMAAWIDGLKISTADYISFVDSDDWVEHNFIEELYKPFKHMDIDISICNYYESHDSKRIKKNSNAINFNGLYSKESLMAVKKHTTIHPNDDIQLYRWNKLFKKSLLLNNLIYCDTRATLNEDSCIVQASILDSKGIFFVKKHLYNYFFRPNSMIHAFNPKMKEKFEIYFNMFERLYKDKVQDYETGLTYERIRIIIMMLKNFFKQKKYTKEDFKNEIIKTKIFENLNLHMVETMRKKHLLIIKLVQKEKIKTLKLLYFAKSIINNILEVFALKKEKY